MNQLKLDALLVSAVDHGAEEIQTSDLSAMALGAVLEVCDGDETSPERAHTHISVEITPVGIGFKIIDPHRVSAMDAIGEGDVWSYTWDELKGEIISRINTAAVQPEAFASVADLGWS
jgi:hypothetical protein